MIEQIGELEMFKLFKQALGGASLQMQQNLATMQLQKQQIDDLTKERDAIKAKLDALTAEKPAA
jgi:hypothetical protein